MMRSLLLRMEVDLQHLEVGVAVCESSLLRSLCLLLQSSLSLDVKS